MAQVRVLSDLTAVIADDLARTDLTDAINKAVEDALQFYQSERFWFSETRTVEFETVADQKIYTSSDDDEIPTFVTIDHAWNIRSGDQILELKAIPISEWEHLSDGSASSGEPYYYTYFNSKIHLYPIPDQAYTIRLTGHQGTIDGSSAGTSFGVGAPNSADPNPYFRNAFELLRAHAKQLIYLHKIQDMEMSAALEPARLRALSALRRETGSRAGKGCIVPTQF